MKNKKSLFIWADNSPFTYHANLILNKFFDGMQYDGNYYGGQILTASANLNLNNKSFDSTHSMAYGLNNIHEGITISNPLKLHPSFKVFANDS